MLKTILIIFSSVILSGCVDIGEYVQGPQTGHKRIYRVEHNPGGLVRRELKNWAERMGQTDHIVVDGTCLSFCAFIALRRWGSCYTAKARLGFHSISSRGGLKALPEYTDYLATWLPEPLRIWFEGTGLKYRPNILGFQTLTWADLQKIWPEGACTDQLIAQYAVRACWDWMDRADRIPLSKPVSLPA